LNRTQQAIDRLSDLRAKQIHADDTLQTFCSQHSQDQADVHKQAELIRTLVDLETKLTKLDNAREYIKVLVIVDELRYERNRINSNVCSRC
jgi:hypothetical protein